MDFNAAETQIPHDNQPLEMVTVAVIGVDFSKDTIVVRTGGDLLEAISQTVLALDDETTKVLFGGNDHLREDVQISIKWQQWTKVAFEALEDFEGF